MSTSLTLVPSGSEWQQMIQMSTMLVKSGFLPTSIKTPEQAIAIAVKGRELGIPMMQAFAQINIIQGKPCLGAELMLAMIYRAIPDAKVEFERYEIDGCTIVATRPGHKPAKFSFDKKDADAAQLTSKDNWKKYPRAMYRSRCIAEMARSVFPDAIMGMSYTPEEMGAVVNDEGEVVDVPHTVAAVTPEVIQEVKASVYNDADVGMQKTLAGILKKQKVDESLWEFVGKKLNGKPSTELKNVIAEVLKEMSQ